MIFSGIAFTQNIDTPKSEIYSKLKCCSCKISFDKCGCPEAVQMKAYIEGLLESGISIEEVFYKIAKKYTLDTILDEKIKKNVEARFIKEAGESHPQIMLDPFFDFGTVSKKEGKKSKVFKISNQGNASLIIRQIKTSCPCASVSLRVDRNKSPYFSTEGSPKDWQAEIKPKTAAELDFMIDLGSLYVKPGKLIRGAEITSNDPVYPELTVRIEAEVKD